MAGRLVYRLTECDSPNSLWLVTVEGEGKNEEIYEKAFGRLLKRGPRLAQEKEDDADDRNQSDMIPRGSSSRSDSGNSGDLEGQTSSGPSDVLLPKSAQNQLNKELSLTTALQSDVSATSNRPKKSSAREQRSMRRQAKMEKATTTTSQDPQKHQPPPTDPKKRPTPPQPCQKDTKTKKLKTNYDPEEVIKVKLNTGILYLHRGLNRKAVFVRRV